MGNDPNRPDSSGLNSEQLNPDPVIDAEVVEEPQRLPTRSSDLASIKPDGVILPAPPSQDEEEKAEGLIRQAMLAKRRGDSELAGMLLEDALQTAPGSPTVLEAIGDDLNYRQQIKAARNAYHLAHRLKPENVQIERKYAELVLKVAQSERVFDSLLQISEFERVTNYRMAVWLSLLLPGLGHVILGQVRKGVYIFAGWVLAWIFVHLSPGGLRSLLVIVGLARGSVGGFTGLILVPLFIALVLHYYAIYDASRKAEPYSNYQPDRPPPPVDMPFE